MVVEKTAGIAQLGERQTEDLKVAGSIPAVGSRFLFFLGKKKGKGQVLPGLEPGSKDSESLVITNYTTRPPMLQEGLEPPTLGLLDPCSTKLSYQSGACLHPGSNQGPSDLQSDALPTEL